MTDEERILSLIEDSIEAIYAYARRHTFNTDEAEELAQEICLALCRSAGAVRSEALYGWLWGVARNVARSYRRNAGRLRANIVFCGDGEIPDTEDGTEYDAGRLQTLRRRLVSLSAQYREMLIMFYYDGMSVESISMRTGVPQGTVKWRLSAGREKIRRDWNEDMKDTVISPVQMNIGITGTGDYGGKVPFPGEYISDELSKNILWHIRREGKTVEELSALTGVPAYYIESSLKNLTKREAVIKSSNRYLADFIIFDRQLCDAINARAYGLAEDIYERVVGAFAAVGGDIWLTAALTLHEVLGHLSGAGDRRKQRTRYDGYHWQYRGHEKGAREIGLGNMGSGNISSGGTYGYKTVRFDIKPRVFDFHDLLWDYEISVCEAIINDSRTAFDGKQLETAASLIERGYLCRSGDGTLEVAIPHFTKAEADGMKRSAREVFRPLEDEFGARLGMLETYCSSHIPVHVREDFTGGKGGMLLAACFGLALERGLLRRPAGKWCEWLEQKV